MFYQSPVLVFSECCVMIKIVINHGIECSNKCRRSVYRLLWKKLVSVLQCGKKKGVMHLFYVEIPLSSRGIALFSDEKAIEFRAEKPLLRMALSK